MDARTRDYFWKRLGQCVATLSNDFVRSHTKLTTKGKLNKSEFHQLMEDVKNIIRGSIEFGHYFGESLRVAHVENEKLRRDYKESLRDAHVQNEKLRRENLALSDKLQQVSDPEIHRNTVAPASKINFHSFPASEASVERKVDSPPGVDPADLSELQEQVQEFVCQNDGDCLVTYKYRRSCNCCRLAKCFRVGMKKSLILSDEEREARNKLVETNRLKRGKVTKCLCDDWMRPPVLIRMPSSYDCLSPTDQIFLANIFHAYENTVIASKNTQFQLFPVVQHTSIHTFFNEFARMFPIFIEYFKHIPEFANLCLDDKIRLVKNHFGIMLNINEPLMHPVTSSNLIATWTNIYGVEIAGRLLKRNHILEQFLYDPILLKIILIVLVLSSSNARLIESTDIDQLCDYPLTIYTAQNIYVDLLWRYILSRSPTEPDAIRFFNKLMMCILHMKNIHMYVYSFIGRFKDEIKQMEPMMKSMWERADDTEEEVDRFTEIDVAEDLPI